MKMLLILLLCAFTAGQASAATLPENTQFFDGFNYPLTIASFTPLPDGAVVLAGSLPHKDEYRDMPDNFSYASRAYEILVDAAAVCIEADGSVRWSLRLGDPQAENAFVCQGILPDGRLLLHFVTSNSAAFGSHHFIVGTDGIVEEMLPTRTLASIGSPKSLQLVDDGFLFGGTKPSDSVFGEEYPQDIIFTDFELNEKWRIPVSGNGIPEFDFTKGADAYFLYGSRMEVNENSADTLMTLSVTKIGIDGDPIWTFAEGPDTGYSAASSLVLLPSGGAAFVSTYAPERVLIEGYDNFYRPSLTVLDANGNHVWSKVYEDFVWVVDAVSFGDGFALIAIEQDNAMIHDFILARVDASGELISRKTYTGADGLVPRNVAFKQAKDGTLYLYGNLALPDDMQARQEGDVVKPFFVALTEAAFE